jgi:hypothetical protein
LTIAIVIFTVAKNNVSPNTSRASWYRPSSSQQPPRFVAARRTVVVYAERGHTAL